MKTAIVTGGAAGIGLCITRKIAEADHHVVIVDLDEAAGCEAIDRLGSAGLSVEFIHEDVSEWRSAEQVVSGVARCRGHIQVLVNNAAVKAKDELLNETEASWREALDVMVTATFTFSQAFIREAVISGSSGSITNIGSVASHLSSVQSPAYHTAKAGVQGLTRYLAVNAARCGARVRVNCVEPGLIVQSRHMDRYLSAENENYRFMAEAYQPLGIVGSEDDVASAVAWLSSDDAKYVSGAALTVDGGASVQEQFTLLSRIHRNS